MIELQRLTGMRPGEVTTMRGCDLDTRGKIWLYRPESHKTAHHEHQRVIALGPKAQGVLRLFLKPDLNAYLFSPREAEGQRSVNRRRQRKTPLWPSHLRHQAKKRERRGRRPFQEHYTVASYRRAIARACEKAGVPKWHPHQLRHSAATRIRREYGLEVARAVLGTARQR